MHYQPDVLVERRTHIPEIRTSRAGCPKLPGKGHRTERESEAPTRTVSPPCVRGQIEPVARQRVLTRGVSGQAFKMCYGLTKREGTLRRVEPLAEGDDPGHDTVCSNLRIDTLNSCNAVC